MSQRAVHHQSFVLCVKNDGFEVDLDTGTVYVALPDEEASRHDQIRVVDESGEDYLYPKDYFVPVEFSNCAREALSAGEKE